MALSAATYDYNGLCGSDQVELGATAAEHWLHERTGTQREASECWKRIVHKANAIWIDSFPGDCHDSSGRHETAIVRAF